MVAFPFSSSLAVAVGGNTPSHLGSAFATVSASIPRLKLLLAAFARLDASRIVASQLIQTRPVGGPIDQAPYVTAVVLVPEVSRAVTDSAALELLDLLQSLETAFGRDRAREQRWGPRSLDLDLLFWGELRMDHPDLMLPHPRMHLRSFVLEPLLQAMQGTHPPCW